MRIRAQSDHPFQRKVIGDSDGKLITFSVRPGTVQGV